MTAVLPAEARKRQKEAENRVISEMSSRGVLNSTMTALQRAETAVVEVETSATRISEAMRILVDRTSDPGKRISGALLSKLGLQLFTEIVSALRSAADAKSFGISRGLGSVSMLDRGLDDFNEKAKLLRTQLKTIAEQLAAEQQARLA